MPGNFMRLAGLFCVMHLAACGGGGSSGGGDSGTSSSSSSSSSSTSTSSTSSSSSSSSSTTTSSSGFGALSDEFEGQTIDLLMDNTSAWQVLHPDMADGIDIGLSVDGALTMLALSSEPEAEMGGWFEDEYSSLVYKNVSGNFSVYTRLRVVDRNDPVVTDVTNISQGPDGAYSAGGFVLRDASGTHNDDENWLMYNMGGQGLNGVTYARELKKTVNSISNLFLTRQDTLEEYMLACRVSDSFYFYTWDENASAWQQEMFYNNVQVNGEATTTATPTGFSIVTEFSDPGDGNSMPMYFDLDLPDTIQVGVISHAWGSPYETQAEYDFVRFAQTAPTTQQECLSNVGTPE